MCKLFGKTDYLFSNYILSALSLIWWRRCNPSDSKTPFLQHWKLIVVLCLKFSRHWHLCRLCLLFLILLRKARFTLSFSRWMFISCFDSSNSNPFLSKSFYLFCCIVAQPLLKSEHFDSISLRLLCAQSFTISKVPNMLYMLVKEKLCSYKFQGQFSSVHCCLFNFIITVNE